MTRHARHATRRPVGRLLVVGALVVATVAGGAAALSGLIPSSLATDAVPSDTPSAEEVRPTASPSPTPTPTRPPDAEFTLVAAGDVLLHQPVLRSARTADGGYDFGPLFDPVAPWVAGADLALCHLEVPVAPEGTTPSGYPIFGAPPQIAASLAASGWDGCSTASNHSVDRGVAGVAATLDALDAAGLGHVGTARTAVEGAAPQVYVLERSGQTLRIAQIAATYGTNGMPVPADAPWTVDLIDTDRLVAQAQAARDAGADVVVASVHCCVEYVSEATEEQVRIATVLADSGVVDLMIGHHAHVPQQIDRLPGGPLGEGMWAAYGLGNFISNQDAECCSARTDSGLLLSASFRKPVDGPVAVTDVAWTAVTVDRRNGHRVEPLPPALRSGQGVGSLTAAEVEARQARVVEVVGTVARERVEPAQPSGPGPVVERRPTGDAAG
ncbi:CapA family protein [Actinotalea sp. K2]|uniref:CapA family protein n=1 Tax=Actinotalea sp. K2 TaxID=2939438 RepID=UPI002016B61F|nr:CapA family protein [Actinotalea sp. K2]MCL3860180.1 CapA family protein [Actinotalea sp. K2]